MLSHQTNHPLMAGHACIYGGEHGLVQLSKGCTSPPSDSNSQRAETHMSYSNWTLVMQEPLVRPFNRACILFIVSYSGHRQARNSWSSLYGCLVIPITILIAAAARRRESNGNTACSSRLHTIYLPILSL
jgi:hypothetical protein